MLVFGEVLCRVPVNGTLLLDRVSDPDPDPLDPPDSIRSMDLDQDPYSESAIWIRIHKGKNGPQK